MRKVFIDIGSHIGQSIHQFYKEVSDAKDWSIFAFEPFLYDNLIHSIRQYSNVKCFKAVVGTSNSKEILYRVPNGGQGATIIPGKLTGGVNYQDKMKVSCIDLLQWFVVNIQPDDFVIVKINIEGGEYALMIILPNLLSSINGIWIKLHHPKFEAVEKKKMIELLRQFEGRVKNSPAFVYCDISEKPYDFKWLVEKSK